MSCVPKKPDVWAVKISTSFIIPHFWCRRRDSNSHALWALDFESSASTNSATSAKLNCKIHILHGFQC